MIKEKCRVLRIWKLIKYSEKK